MGIRDLFKSKKKGEKYDLHNTPYYRIGGEMKVRELANSFYDIMESDPLATELLTIHPQPIDRVRHVFFLYLTMWLGGPDDFQQQFGHPRLRARHMLFAVSPELKDQWMYCMRKAMFNTVDDLALAQQLLKALDDLAEHMINTK